MAPSINIINQEIFCTLAKDQILGNYTLITELLSNKLLLGDTITQSESGNPVIVLYCADHLYCICLVKFYSAVHLYCICLVMLYCADHLYCICLVMLYCADHLYCICLVMLYSAVHLYCILFA